MFPKAIAQEQGKTHNILPLLLSAWKYVKQVSKVTEIGFVGSTMFG